MQVAAAQQYSVTLRGYPALHEWVKKHTWALHNPPGEHDVLVTGGSNATIEVGSVHTQAIDTLPKATLWAFPGIGPRSA